MAGPAGLLAKLTPEYMDVTFWIIVVFVYYMLATLLPVDKIIGKNISVVCHCFIVYGGGDFGDVVMESSGIARNYGRAA